MLRVEMPWAASMARDSSKEMVGTGGPSLESRSFPQLARLRYNLRFAFSRAYFLGILNEGIWDQVVLFSW